MSAPAKPLTTSAPVSSCRPAGARSLWSSCDSLDRLTLAYLALLNSLILIFPGSLPMAGSLFTAHLLIAAGVVSLAAAARRWSSPGLHFFRHWSPLLLFLFFFEELGRLVRLVHPGWFDRYLLAFDYALFGFQPALVLQRFASPWLNDAMQFAYFTYYLYPLVLGAWFSFHRRFLELRFLMLASAMAYYPGYICAIFLPIEGPYHTLAARFSGPLQGGPVTALMDWIERFGRVHGAAFPSAHVSGATVAVLCSWYFSGRSDPRKTETAGLPASAAPLLVPVFPRLLFWLFLPFYFLLLVATVYGRYHYVADVFAGLLAGSLGFLLARWLSPPIPARFPGANPSLASFG